MKVSLRLFSLSFLVLLAICMGSESRGEDLTAEKHPSAAAEAPKPGMKEIPEDLNADLNVSFYSKYVWRGYELSKDSLVIFPTATVGYKGFAVNLWADMDTRFYGGPDKEFKIQETDVTVSYSNAIAPLKLNYSLGWIYYNYQPNKNQEVFATFTFDTILKPTFCVYNEIEIGQAWYFLLGLSHSIPVYRDFSLDLAATVAYLHDKSEPSDFSNFHDGNLTVGMKIPLNKYLSVSPRVQYSFPLNEHARREIRDLSFTKNDSDFVYGGLVFDLAI
ncbi:hypothetical protein LPW11_01855 [Geomonas sp. RF6]|uniref:TorF family putative porin n=1 Tax=Geomonas sp. RF6 TaxID=2897342 RepID=UPI001E4C5666|nr:TorF family putative porin [Geomonas sp. RF6]UFS70941.1 hypothetical protein LPW11_01855 [Geomonas sp. RF6]